MPTVGGPHLSSHSDEWNERARMGGDKSASGVLKRLLNSQGVRETQRNEKPGPGNNYFCVKIFQLNYTTLHPPNGNGTRIFPILLIFFKKENIVFEKAKTQKIAY